jgi:hypothetical protein
VGSLKERLGKPPSILGPVIDATDDYHLSVAFVLDDKSELAEADVLLANLESNRCAEVREGSEEVK